MKLFFLFLIGTSTLCRAQEIKPETLKWQGKFEQLDHLLPTPNEYRTGSGSPGPRYWQQKADYVIAVDLNDDHQTISGSETITYHNNAPETLTYLWLQLDQNILDKDNSSDKTKLNSMIDSLDTKTVAGQFQLYDFDGGFKIKAVKATNGIALNSMINKTMMRVDLPKPLLTGQVFSLMIEWSYHIGERMKDGQRSGLEYFPKDGNYVYQIAQFFPRMCVYDDVVGWQNKQFLGQGEFTLPFGDYKVRITVPADHIVAATGVLKNAKETLTQKQLELFEKAKNTFDNPVIIVSQSEVIAKEKNKSSEKKTWEFEAENVRDFAFVSSRKFIWDAMAVKVGNNTPIAMSFYPKEGNPLWEHESTKAIKNTLVTYSKYTIDYPYPVAISVHAAGSGMEYPMICFNYGRPTEDGFVSNNTKWRMISVVIHEVGHNFFPMIVNSDERQSSWMDEGLNSFMQYLTEGECYPTKPKGRGYPANLVTYMKGAKNIQRPVMTNPEQVILHSPEQYAKVATSLTILRETVMGQELFDKAFKEYALRWAFKHPKPADFFRTLEDASAVDLDWFWRGWFYTTDNVDLSLDNVKWFQLRTEKNNLENKNKNVAKGDLEKNKDIQNVADFSKGPNYFSVIPTDKRFYGEFVNTLDDKAVIAKLENKNFYELTFSNKGGLVMPLVIEWTYQDGSKEIERIPAEIWRINEHKVTKVFTKDKEVVSVVLDPQGETTDITIDDNAFPRANRSSKFDELKRKTN